MNIERFFQGIENGDIKYVQRCIEEGQDVNAGFPEDDLRPLHMAVKSNHLHVCKLLIENGANVNVCDIEDGWAAIHWAANPGIKAEIMIYLLKMDANPNAKTVFGRSALHDVMFEYNPTKIFHLLNTKNSNDSLMTVDSAMGETPLSCAITHLHKFDEIGHKKCEYLMLYKELIKRGSNVNVIRTDGNNLLQLAVIAQCYETVKLLLEYDMDVNNMNKEGSTALHCLSRTSRSSGDLEPMFNLLVKCGANVNALTRTSNNNLFHVACTSSSIDVAKILMKLGVDINAKNYQNMTPLHYCAQQKEIFNQFSSELFSYVIKYSSSCCTKDIRGWTPLHHAVLAKNKISINLLLQFGANLEDTDRFGRTCLHLSTNTEDDSIPILLLDNGANIEARDMYGATALFYAVFHQNIPCVKQLLHKGSEVNYTDNSGYTAADLAEYFKDEEMIQCIKMFTAVQVFVKYIEDNKDNDNYGVDSNGVVYVGSDNNDDDDDNSAYEIDDDNSAYEVDDDDDNVLNLCDLESWLREVEWKDDVETFIAEFLNSDPVMNSKECFTVSENVLTLIGRIALAVKNIDPRIEFTPVLSGSVSEGTKISEPDEYDFLVVLSNFADYVEIIEEDSNPAGYCQVKAKSFQNNPSLDAFFDENGFLQSDILSSTIYGSIVTVLKRREIWENLGFLWEFGPMSRDANISSINLRWIGSIYKDISISIDVVPAIELPEGWSGKKVSQTSLVTAEMKQTGCLVITKALNKKGSLHTIMRFSFSKIETMIIKSQPGYIVRGYMLAKAIRTIVPKISEDEFPRVKHNISTEITSYLLKTALFELLERETILDLEMDYNSAVRQCAFEIWTLVYKYIKEGGMKSFFIERYLIYDKAAMDEIQITLVEAFSTIMVNFLTL